MSGSADIKRGWSIIEESRGDIVQDDTEITYPKEVYMLWLPIGTAIRAGATSFSNAFDPDSAVMVFYEAVMQLMLKVVAELRSEYNNESPEKIQYCGDPIEMYLEVVMGKDLDQTAISSSIVTDTDYIQDRPFMRGIPDARPVVEYRLWIFVREKTDKMDFGRIFKETIMTVEKEFQNIMDGVREKRYTDSNSNGDTGVSLSSYHGTTATAYGTSLKDVEKWKLVRSMPLWSKLCDSLIGVTRLSRTSMTSRIITKDKPFDENPIHPRYVLSPYLYFAHPNQHAQSLQQKFDNYTNPARTIWKFPCSTVRISREDESTARLMKKFFPDYYVRERLFDVGAADLIHVAPRLSVSYLETLQANTMVRGGRSMIHLDLGIGEAGDADALSLHHDLEDADFPDVMQLGADDSDGTDGSTTWGTLDAGVAVHGGCGPTDIMSMINSVPLINNKNGAIECFDPIVLMREDFEGSTSLTAQRMLNASDDPERSAFHYLRYRGVKMQADLLEMVSSGDYTQAELRKAKLHIQQWLVRSYEDSCMKPTSDVSREGQSINGWFYARQRKGNKSWLGHDAPLMDPSMSTFANIIIRRMFRLENTSYVANCHIILLTLLIGALDAFRHEFELHWNALLSGSHSTSKSFALTTMQKLRIPGTVNILGETTNRALYVDTDLNDQTQICHELRPDYFKDSKKHGDDTKEAQQKESMTSCVRTIITFHKEDSGKRTCRITYSEQISSLTGCSNLPKSEFSEAIQSRMSAFEIVDRNRVDRHAADLQGVEKEFDAAAEERKRNFTDEMSCEQYLHYHVNKLIGICAMHDVTLNAFTNIRQLFRRYLRERHVIHVPIRTFARAAMLIRSLVITRALEYLFSSPKSKYYGKPFSIKQLLDIEPLLHDDEEIVYFALDLLRHEMIPETRTYLLTAMHDTYLIARRAEIDRDVTMVDKVTQFRNLYLLPTTEVELSAFAAARIISSSSSSSSSSQESENSNGARQFFRTGSLWRNNSSGSRGGFETRHVLASAAYPREYMNAYLRITGSFASISKSVENATLHASMVIGETECKKTLDDLTKQTIIGKQYRWNAAKGEPEPVPGSDATYSVPAVIRTFGAIFIHLDLLNNFDPVTEAIQFCYSKTLLTRKTYITGLPLSNDYPHILKTRTVDGDRGGDHVVTDFIREITIGTMLANSELFEEHTTTATDVVYTGREEINHHYDELSRRKRADVLFLDQDVDELCSFEPYEKFARQRIPPEHPLASKRTLYNVNKLSRDYPFGCVSGVQAANVREVVAPIPVEEPEVPPVQPQLAKQKRPLKGGNLLRLLSKRTKQ